MTHPTLYVRGHFTHEPRAMTMKLWEPKRKCPKAVPTHLQSRVVWSGTLKCSAKSYVTAPSTKLYFNEFLFMRILTHDKEVDWINSCEYSECHGLPVLREPYLQEVVFENNPSDHEIWIVWCHVRIHIDFTSILHSYTLLVPQA